MRRKYLANGKEGHNSHRTVAELAEFLGVSPRTIERWHKDRKIPDPDVVTAAGWKLWSKEQASEILNALLEGKGRIKQTW